MSKISKLVNTIQTINITSVPIYYSLENKGVKKDTITEDEKHLYEEEYLYVITTNKESEIRALYNETRISLTDLSQEQLRNRLKILQSYQYEELYEELAIFNTKYNNTANWADEKRLKKVLRKHMICSIPLRGKFTVRFLCGLTGELQRYCKYMEALKKDVSTLLNEDNTKYTSITDFNMPGLSYSLSPNVDIAINRSNGEIDFLTILGNALNYCDDKYEMKEFFRREHKNNEEKSSYNEESFYKGLLSVAIKERDKYYLWERFRNTAIDTNSVFSLPSSKRPQINFTKKKVGVLIQIINDLRFENSFKDTESLVVLNNNITLPKRVKALFLLIEFLHLNTDNFTKYNDIFYDQTLLFFQKHYYGFPHSSKDFVEHIDNEKSLQSKDEVIHINIVEPIKSFIQKLNICEWAKLNSLWDSNIEDIEKLHKNYYTEDIKIIKEYELKYVEYRKETNCDYCCNDFFYDLDKTLNHLFSFFRDKEVADKMAQQDEKINKQKIKENKTLLSSHTLEHVNGSRNKTNITKYTSKHYALAFIFDCLATGVDFTLYDSKKMDLEAIGEKRLNGALSGNTFYKAFNSIMSEKINLKNERDLIYLAGDNWRKIIIELSHESEKVTKYIKEEVFYEKGGNRATAP